MERKPLDRLEEETFRAFMRLLIVLPRSMDNEMQQRSGLGLTQYFVLMSLSEAPENQLCMSDLASHTAMSASRMTRVVALLEHDGLVTRTVSTQDKRSSMAHLTGPGLERLQSAWPSHLESVRELIFDHLDATELPQLARIFSKLLRAAEERQ